jgi:hypothetical protein
MDQEDILDNIIGLGEKPPKLLANQWWFLIWEFTLLIVTVIHTVIYEHWPSSRIYLTDSQEILAMFILFYIAVVPFFNTFIESIRLRVAVGFWLLINYGLIYLVLPPVLFTTFDYCIIVVIALSYTVYVIMAPRFESKEKGASRKNILTLFYLVSSVVLISTFSSIYKKPIIPFYYFTFVLVLLTFGAMFYLIYKNKDDFELLLYIPRLLIALIMISLVIYS